MEDQDLAPLSAVLFGPTFRRVVLDPDLTPKLESMASRIHLTGQNQQPSR